MSERSVDEVQRTRPASTVSVLIEWLKDNRKALERRLDSQDRTLSEIHTETRATNGRVSVLERRMDLANVIDETNEGWQHQLAEHHDETTALMERRKAVRVAAAATLTGGFLASIPELGRIIGVW